MKIGALDKIANIQTRISEIEERISGFSEIFQAELKNATTEEASAGTVVEATAETTQADYATLAALLTGNNSLNSLFVDPTDTSNSTTLFGDSLQQTLTGNADITKAIETYLNNKNGVNSINNVLGIGTQSDTLNAASILENLTGQVTQQSLMGNVGMNTAVEAYLKNKYYSDTSGISSVLGTSSQLDTLNISDILHGLVGQTDNEEK